MTGAGTTTEQLLMEADRVVQDVLAHQWEHVVSIAVLLIVGGLIMYKIGRKPRRIFRERF